MQSVGPKPPISIFYALLVEQPDCLHDELNWS